MDFKKNISAANLLISSVAFIIFGFYILIGIDNFIIVLPKITGGIFIFATVTKFLSYYLDKYKNRIRKKSYLLLEYIGLIGFSIICFSTPHIFLLLFPISIIFYAVCVSIVSIISWYQYETSNIQKSYTMFLKAIISFLIAIILITRPVKYQTIISLEIIGIYLIFYGITLFRDFLHEERPLYYTNKIKRRISVRLPVLITANLPRYTLGKINNFLSFVGEDKKEINLSENQEDTNPDMEVLIHVKKGGLGAFGHVDISINGNIISYGNYDEASIKMMGATGDGVLFFIKDKLAYIKFCNEHYNKTIFEYGIKLNEEQKKRVNEKIFAHTKNSYTWIAPVDRNINKDNTYEDYASELSMEIPEILFKKIKKGKFRKYFTLNTNCVKFADSIIGEIGIDILNINGIITPGVYFDYFDREYRRQNSLIITKKVYNPKAIVK